MNKKLEDANLKRFLDRHDEKPPQAPAGEWAALRARALEEPRPAPLTGRAPVWRWVALPSGLAAAAIAAVVLLRSPTPEPLPHVSMAAMPQEDAQVEALLVDSGFVEEMAEPDEEAYLALLE